jgi:DNA repair photolyase
MPRCPTPVLLRPRKSRFTAIFRTTPPQTVCPNFYVLAHAAGCTFAPRCRYCYLKSSYWHTPRPLAFSNTRALVAEIRRWIAKDGLESCILNAGNLCDSLAFEKARPLMARLVALFRAEAEARGRPHALLLVTKGGTRECRDLFRCAPSRNVIVSFSVNNPKAAGRYEEGAAPVADRLAAARRLKRAGWRIRMRIDPMILGFDYGWIAREVRKLRPERITLGTLRAEANLHRFTEKGLFGALEIPNDAKSLARYPRAVRLRMYRAAVRVLGRSVPLGLCEETLDVWKALRFDFVGKTCNCG